MFTEPPFETSFHWMAGPREIATDQLTNAYSPGSPMLRALVENRAFFHCYESLQVYRASDPDRPLLSVQGTARVSDVTFSPNRVAFNVFGGPEPAKLLLNYNWAPGWSSTAGPIELIGAPGKLAHAHDSSRADGTLRILLHAARTDRRHGRSSRSPC